jgi:hypothetical protein
MSWLFVQSSFRIKWLSSFFFFLIICSPDERYSRRWWLSRDLFRTERGSNRPKCWRWKRAARWRNESAKLRPKVCWFCSDASDADTVARSDICRWVRKWKEQWVTEEGIGILPPAKKVFFFLDFVWSQSADKFTIHFFSCSWVY